MPVKSKKQWAFMGAVASGRIKKKGLPKAKAHEFLDASKGTYEKLPAKAAGRVR